MLTYKRISNKNGIMRYEYYPAGDVSAPGIVEYDGTGKSKLIQESPKDVKGYYAIHALNHIDTNTESGTVAWY